jgi:hypothetical protein
MLAYVVEVTLKNATFVPQLHGSRAAYRESTYAAGPSYGRRSVRPRLFRFDSVITFTLCVFESAAWRFVFAISNFRSRVVYATAADARPEWSTRMLYADKSLELLRGAPIAHSEMDLNLFLPYGK